MKTYYNLHNGGMKAFAFSLLVTAFATADTFAQQSALQTADVATNVVITRNIPVSGRVVDSTDNSPLPSVSVRLKGTDMGITTDGNGNFNFPMPLAVNDVLAFSYVGYTTQEYTITDKDRDGEIKIALVFGMDILGEAAEEGVYKSKRFVFKSRRVK